ncbi:MAG: hypothetical protein ABIY40_06085 [Rhodanobacteraceae bacterium]
MIAADRRRLTSALGALCALLALLLVVLWAGLGRRVHWDDGEAPPRLPLPHAATPPPVVAPLQAFAQVWERPLFSPDRKPSLSGGNANADAGDLELTGVIVEPGLRMALLREKSSGHTLRVREGERAGDSGVTLIEVKPRSAVVDAGGSRSELALKVGPAPGGNAVDNAQPAAPPTGAETAPQDNNAAATAAMEVASPQPGDTSQNSDGAQDAAAARIKALKARIEQRRKQAAQQQQNDSGD